MAHLEQRNFCIRVKERLPDFFKNKKVLDIGSLDINGSNRFLFENCNYLGIDVGEGRNVDYVSVGHLFDGPDNYFDTIISTEVFEHDMFYEDTIKNIMRMLKPGGLFLFTCAAPGRPEHGTRRCGEDCAPLLIQISENWADYYKNLDENDVRKISGFNETFPDGYFELNNLFCEIPADLYFYGIKGGEKYITNRIKPEFNKEDFDGHIFVVDSWPDNDSKEKDLIQLIKRLKIYNIPILLTGHFPIKPEIQKMVDYYIFDKNNPLLLSEEFIHHGVGSGRWTEDFEYVIENAMEFHHDYAIWETMRNAFNYCKYLGKKYIHFLEYDNLPNKVQYRQTFLERIKEFDAILYEYSEGSSKFSHLNPYCATYIFSIRTDIAVLTIDQIKSKYEYFTNKPKGWQLERVFLDCLRKVTDRIHITDYITNENEFNTQAVWNRDGMNRNGAIFQVYPAVDYNGELYIHLISGFSDIKAKEDYLLELRYGGFKRFVTLQKGHMMNVHVGKYRKGSRIKINYKGNEVYSEFLGKDLYDFIQINKITFKNKEIEQVTPKKININFVDGAFVEIFDEFIYERKFNIDFVDQKNQQNLYGTVIKNGWWTKTTKKYFIDWNIKIKSDRFNFEYKIDLLGKRILISFESKSLGDTLAWIPYVDEFRKKHKCHIICSTFFNEFLMKQYPEMEFVLPGTTVNSIYAMYSLGLFYKNGDIDTDRHPSNPLKEPLAKIASDILGLDYVEIKPKLPKLGKKKYKRVCIGIHSTAQTKYWNNPDGWQNIVDFLNKNGYEVRLLSKEEDGYMGNFYPKGITKQPPSDLIEILKTLQESEFFIGISSGLSWLAWASNIPVVLISGFTDDYLEPKQDIIRIINKEVCHGCWHNHKFDAGDWNWCPEHKGTERQFECTKFIEFEDVIEKVKPLLK